MGARQVSFIAEVSSNHASDLARCYRFIDAAAGAGCDAIKFQLFRIDQLFAPEILQRSEKHRRRREWELPTEFIPELARHCAGQGIQFICTPFYLEAVEILAPHVDCLKIASYELLWDDLLIACAESGKPVMLSSGMATLDEARHAVELVRRHGCGEVSLLHCLSAYPAPVEQVNLAAIETLRQACRCPIGWSDHTVAPGVIHRAVHRWGAEIIEFHLDLEGAGAEYAAGHCWLPQQIKPVIDDVRLGLQADGDGVKAPAPGELDEVVWRADPEDGLRPFKPVRARYRGE